MPLNLQKIRLALASTGNELGVLPEFRQIQPKFDVHLFDSLPSTSTQLWKMLAAGAGSGTVAIARRQTSGRGQRGRSWQSEPGGLYLSLALEPDWPIAHSAQLTCLSAWGIATALINLGLPIQIKWPNDLFFQGKKLGGILTETKVAQRPAHISPHHPGAKPSPCIKQAVIGVGINWHNSVPATGITLHKILEQMPSCAAQNKINCLEILAALVLRGILQGVFYYQQVGSQVFMKVYSKLLTQVGELVSLESDLPTDAIVGNYANMLLAPSLTSSVLAPSLLRVSTGDVRRSDVKPDAKPDVKPDAKPAEVTPAEVKFECDRQGPCGKVMGVSEEGYLQIELAPATGQRQKIVLLKPSELHTS
ncbi:MAG: biotin--[acetyl-CoA-carboxylase] ligase [Phormidesmis sp. RL_2_1]|nr:biotin--[acetyl-CoA-carboxylase] ligase [Phormidesmis sp. RL_2_1]